MTPDSKSPCAKSSVRSSEGQSYSICVVWVKQKFIILKTRINSLAQLISGLDFVIDADDTNMRVSFPAFVRPSQTPKKFVIEFMCLI